MPDRSPPEPLASDAPWWGDYRLSQGQFGRWQLGPLALRIERRREGWILAWKRNGDRRSTELSVECPVEPGGRPPEVMDDEEQSRVCVLSGADAADDGGLVLTPLTADRTVVTRPDAGCRVLPGRSVTLYVSTPLWLRVTTDDGETLLEEPTVRLTDTWFGSSTRTGELCYAIRTRAFADLEELPILAFRAITRLRIENTSHGELELVRLALPAPSLSLWFDAGQPGLGLWTSPVVLRRSSDGETAELDVVGGAPPELSNPQRVAWARQRHNRNVLVRAMSAILG